MSLKERGLFDHYKKHFDKETGEAECEAGMRYLYSSSEKEKKNAFICFETASRMLDDGRPFFGMGECYKYGWGVEKNPKKAFEMYEIAVSKGHNLALFCLMNCYERGFGTKKNPYIPFATYQRAVLDNEGKYSDKSIMELAKMHLGLCYYHGIGIKKDEEKALKYFEEGDSFGRILYPPVIKGDMNKAAVLGSMYLCRDLEFNVTVVPDAERAVEFLSMACSANCLSSVGMMLLANCFRQGRGTAVDYGRAFELTEKALENDEDGSCYYRFGQHLYYGVGTKKDAVSAVRMFEKAVDRGESRALKFLAFCYADGQGVEKNYNKARELIEAAPDCDFLRGVLIWLGKWGYDKDRARACSLIKEYSEKGGFDSQNAQFTCKAIELGCRESFGEWILELFVRREHWSFLPKQKRRHIPFFVRSFFFLMPVYFKLQSSDGKPSDYKLILDRCNELEEEMKRLTSLVAQSSERNLDAVSGIYKKQDRVLSAVYENARGIKDISYQLSDLSTRINGIRDELNSGSLTDERIAGFIKQASEEINRAVTGDKAFEDEETQLCCLFGDIWNCFDRYTQISLTSARVILSGCRNAGGDMDFSGAVISSVSALENELQRRFFDGFQEFLTEKYGSPSELWHEAMLYRTYEGVLVTDKKAPRFNMGLLPYIFNCKSEDERTLGLYLECISSRSQDREAFDSFIKGCEEVRIKYRNTAAHTSRVSRSDAEECCDRIIGASEASEELCRVQGLLFRLVTLTDRFGIE